MKYTIYVGREHIDRGTPQCPSTCPVSLAIFEQTGIEAEVLGDVAFLRFPSGDRRVVGLPIEVLRFVGQFDAHPEIPMEPFSFILDTDDCIEAEGWSLR